MSRGLNQLFLSLLLFLLLLSIIIIIIIVIIIFKLGILIKISVFRNAYNLIVSSTQRKKAVNYA